MLIPKIPASSFVSLHVSPFICLPACWLPKSLPLLVSLLHLSAFICLPACWFPKPPFFICLPSFVSLLGSSNRKKPRVTLFSSETLSGVYAGIIFNALHQNPPEGTVPVAFHPMHSCHYLFDTYSDMGLGSVHRLAARPKKMAPSSSAGMPWLYCAGLRAWFAYSPCRTGAPCVFPIRGQTFPALIPLSPGCALCAWRAPVP